MKQYQVNAASVALRKISTFQMPIRSAYEIYKLIRQLEPVCSFAVEREKQMLDQYHGTVKPDGTVIFPTPDETAAFRDGVRELNNMEVDLEIAPVMLNYDALGDKTLSPADIASLEGFVTFE